MNLSVSGFRRLKEIIRKTGTKVCIIRRSGLPFLFTATGNVIYCFLIYSLYLSYPVYDTLYLGN
ncbi:MAG: sporulation protein YqfD [Dorea longicatena]